MVWSVANKSALQFTDGDADLGIGAVRSSERSTSDLRPPAKSAGGFIFPAPCTFSFSTSDRRRSSSSSIDTDEATIAEREDRRLARGQIERIGGEAIVTLTAADGTADEDERARFAITPRAVEYVIAWLTSAESNVPISTRRRRSRRSAIASCTAASASRTRRCVDDEVWRGIEELIELAPLHNPHNLRGIAAARAVLGAGVPQVAVFDTAFHHNAAGDGVPLRDPVPVLPPLRRAPLRLPRHVAPLRRVPLSPAHRPVARGDEDHHAAPRQRRSACAIDGGESVDTSMGLHAARGARHGHALRRPRSGDPRVHRGEGGHDAAATSTRCSTSSPGCSASPGSRPTCASCWPRKREHGDRRARLAIDVFCYRVKKYIGAYLAAMNGADAIVFAGGIGENAPAMRARICAGLDWLGIALDDAQERRARRHAKAASTRPGRGSSCGSCRRMRNCSSRATPGAS